MTAFLVVLFYIIIASVVLALRNSVNSGLHWVLYLAAAVVLFTVYAIMYKYG